MTLRHMKIFCALCKNNCSTTKTAEALNLTQPAISQAIREMEEFYGIKLFDRIGRKLVITKAGNSLLNYATHISALFNEAEEEMRNFDKFGSISVGASLTIGSLFLPKYVKIFNDEHPNIKVKSLVAQTNVLEQKILSYELDVALIEDIAHDPAIISEPYMDDELCIVHASDGKYASGQTISVDEFKEQNILVRESGNETREVFDRATEKSGFFVAPAWEAISTVALVNAALSGLGFAVVPYRIVNPYIKYGALVNINVEGLDLNRKFYIIRHKDKILTTAAEKFLEFCRNYESEYPAPVYLK